MERSSVRKILSENSGAELLGGCSLGEGFSFARWRNGPDRVSYPGADHHTFSVYFRGYENARRLDRSIDGRDGSFCLMPAGAPSEWEIGGPIGFFHIYFTDESIRAMARTVYDRSGADWSLPDIAYRVDRELFHLCQWFLHAPIDSITGDTLLAEQNRILIMTYLAGRVFPSPAPAPAKGGLSPGNRRRVREYMEEGYSRNLPVRELADLAGLSEFHFLRMFRQSFGVTPHDYLNGIRIERAMEMIRRGLPLIRIAAEAGFSSQPHFSRVFRERTGFTPARYAREYDREA